MLSIRALSRSRLARPQPPRRPVLQVTALEDRVVPQAVDVAGLRFDVPGKFTSTPVAGGTKFTSAEPVLVGLPPADGAKFVPLFTLDDGGTITAVGKGGTVGWMNRLSAVTAGPAVPLFVGPDTQDIAPLLPTATGDVPTRTTGKAMTVNGLSLTPTGLRIVAPDKLGLTGNLAVNAFGGISTPVSIGGVTTTPATQKADFSTDTIVGGFQIGKTSTFNVGGLTFSGTPNKDRPEVGGFVRITPSSNTVEIAGQATFDLAGKPVTISTGQYDVNDATKFAPGVTFVDGKVTAFELGVSGELTAGGATFTAQGLTGRFTAADNTFTFKGTAGLAVRDASLTVAFGDGTTPGLVLTDGKVTAANFKVNADFKLGGVQFAAKDLTTTFDAAAAKYTVTGSAGATFAVKDKSPVSVDVALGQGDFPGLVIEDGKLTRLAAAVSSNFSVLGLDVSIDKLGFNYVADRNEFGLFGSVKLSTADGPAGKVLDNFGVQLGQGSFDAPGIRIVDGTLTDIDVGIDGSFKLAKLNVTANSLRVKYTSADGILQFTGGLKVALTSSFSAEVALTNGGLTIDTGNGQVKLGGVRFRLSDANFGPLAINNLEVAFSDGPNGVNIDGSAEVRLPGNLTVGAGLKIIDGNLDSISVSVSKENPGFPVVGGVFVTRIAGSISGLSDPNNFMLTGSVDMSVGPRVNFLGSSFSLATVSGTISINKERLAVSGMVNVLEGKAGSASGEVAVFFQGDTAATVKITDATLFGVFTGSLSFSVSNAGDVTLNSMVGVKVPDPVPLIGGRTLAEVSLYLQVRPNELDANSYGMATLKIGPKPPDVTLSSTGDFAADLAAAVAKLREVERSRAADLNADGVEERITWTLTGTLTVYDGRTQSELFTTQPFGVTFTGDLHVTAADVSGDGVADLIVSPADGGAARVRGYDGRSFTDLFDFFGLADTSFRGGTYTAVGDVNADGVGDLIVTAGLGGGPRVAGYDGRTLLGGNPQPLFADFFGFETDVREGALALVRDLDADGHGDLILANPAGGATTISGAELLKNIRVTVSEQLEEAKATAKAQAAAGDPDAVVRAEFLDDIFNAIGDAVTSVVNTVAEAVSTAVNAVVDTVSEAISFTAALKVNFAGRAVGVVKSGLGPQLDFDVTIPGLSASALAADGMDTQVTASALPVDLRTVTKPTVRIESAAAPEDTPTGVVTFSGTTQFPAGTTVELFLTDRNRDYAGRRIASMPYAPGTQSFTIPDLSAMAAQPFDPDRPLYVYAAINDGVSVPVFSNETTVLLPNDYSPALVGPVGQTLKIVPNRPLTFAGDTALSVTDPLPGGQVQLELDAEDGILTATPTDGVTIDRNGSTAVTLTGPADRITAALAGLVYTPNNPAFPMPDRITSTLTRFPQMNAGLIRFEPIELDVTSVTLSVPDRVGYTQGSGPQPVLAAAETASMTSGVLTAVSITIDGYEPGFDVLEATRFPDIAERFDANTGTLRLVGTAAVDEYNAALRAVTFRTTSPLPKALVISQPDDDGDIFTERLEIDVTAGELPPKVPESAYTPTDAPGVPRVTTQAQSVDAAMDTSVVRITPGLRLTSDTPVTGAVARIGGGFVPGEDVLAVIALPAGITARYDDATGILVFEGEASAADYETALARLRFADRSHVRTGGSRAVLITATNAAGVSDDAVVSVAVAAPPVVDTDAAVLDYTTGGQAAAIAPRLEVAYRGGLLDGATVAFAGDFEPIDVLAFTPKFGITGGYDPEEGVLTLTGRATAEQYQEVLRGVTYNSTEVNPEIYERAVLIQATAGGMNSDDTGTVTLNVDPAHVGPRLTIPPGGVTVPERAVGVPVAPGLTITAMDPNDTTIDGVVIHAEGVFDAASDLIEFGPLPAGVTAEMDGENGELVFTGTAPLADYEALLRSVTFRSTDPSPVNPTGGLPLTFYLEDGFGESPGETVNVFVNPANDPPTSTGAPPADVAVPMGGGAKSLGLGGLNYAPPDGFGRLLITVTDVPDPSFVGVIRLADRSVADVNTKVTLDQLRGAAFIPSANAKVGNAGTFRYTVAGIQDGATWADAAELVQQLTVSIPKVSAVNGGSETLAASASGGTVALFDGSGRAGRTLTPFAGYTGGLRTAVGDFTGDGVPDVAAATAPGLPAQVAILDGKTGEAVFRTQPFEDAFTGGAFVAAGDLNGDGTADLAVSPDAGGGGRVRVFDGRTFAVLADFFGIDDPNFRGGARVSIGDVTGDGTGDLLVAAGTGGGPRVAGYDGRSLGGGAVRKAFADFFAFETDLRNGAYVAAGDTNGDNVADLILGGGPGGAPRVRVLSGAAMTAGQSVLLADFFAGDLADRDGARVAAKDLDGDAVADVVVGVGGRVSGFRGSRLTEAVPPEALGLTPFDALAGGVFVG